ncbi:16S rRNA (cytidine(1402)-2'-O)-methyltransferase [bacterium]|nr:16S rRNA (cytidine(1402)-2'-O)-methyltransferase [bacterium]
MLYIVATPLGNLEDLTPRALRIFQEVDAIAAEDTRHTIQLLSHFGIQKPLFAFHQHNEREATEQLIEKLAKGQNIALVSDAGYPCVSDAGSYLTQTLRDRNITYTCLPGACAVETALVLSGLPTETYTFLGFLPREGKEREQSFKKIENTEETTIVFESPLRIIKLIKDLKPYLKERKISLLREMTKIHEECVRGTIDEVLTELESRAEIKGECVLAIEGAKEEEVENNSQALTIDDAVRKVLLLKKKADLSLSQSAQAVSLITGHNRKELYKKALDLES